MTPLHIKILLHYYSHYEPWPYNGGCALEYTHNLVDWGLLEVTDDVNVCKCTNKGNAHIEQIVNLPLPTQAWIDHAGKVIKI